MGGGTRSGEPMRLVSARVLIDPETLRLPWLCDASLQEPISGRHNAIRGTRGSLATGDRLCGMHLVFL